MSEQSQPQSVKEIQEQDERDLLLRILTDYGNRISGLEDKVEELIGAKGDV